MFQRLVQGFWNEEVWLPPNTTWADLAPGPDKAVVYTDHRHVFVPIPLALFFITLRYLLERLIFAPFGRYLGIKDRKPKKPPPNPKLEAAYKENPRTSQQLVCALAKQLDMSERQAERWFRRRRCQNKPSTLVKFCENVYKCGFYVCNFVFVFHILAQVCALAKQLDMSERQVERWFRQRRAQNKPSTLVKFCENVFKCGFYVCNFVFGLVVLWDKDWLWDIDQCYIGYPHQGITNDVWWYYMVSAAFYWSLTISQFWDVRRKDFWQMFVHHIATIALLSFSWVCNLHRIGTLVLLLHDCADIFVESVKAAKYARYQKLCDALFLCLIVMWIGTRVGIFPFYIIWSTSIRAPMLVPMFPAYYIFNSLLCLLLMLHVVWTCLILQIAYYAVKAGQMDGDVRSSSSELSDSPGHSNQNSPTRNNKKHE